MTGREVLSVKEPPNAPFQVRRRLAAVVRETVVPVRNTSERLHSPHFIELHRFITQARPSTAVKIPTHSTATTAMSLATHTITNHFLLVSPIVILSSVLLKRLAPLFDLPQKRLWLWA